MTRMVLDASKRVELETRRLRRTTPDAGLAVRSQMVLHAAKDRFSRIITEAVGCSRWWVSRALCLVLESRFPFGSTGMQRSPTVCLPGKLDFHATEFDIVTEHAGLVRTSPVWAEPPHQNLRSPRSRPRVYWMFTLEHPPRRYKFRSNIHSSLTT